MASPPRDDEEPHHIWERVMGFPRLPRGYEKTSVLLLTWDKDDDDTKSYEEVRIDADLSKEAKLVI
jgi:hypothetical protein